MSFNHLSLLFPSYVFRYCSKLPGDQFTHPKPVYTVEECGKDYYTCKLQLPINCKLRDTIVVSCKGLCLFLCTMKAVEKVTAVLILTCNFIVGSVSSLAALVMMS